MKLRETILLAAVAASSSTALAQTATISLTSPQNGQTIAPGSVVTWEIYASASAADNLGLALVLTDLVQDASNPSTIDLQPADGVPSGMMNFSRPAGFSNPGDDGGSGYVGLLRGDASRMNVLEIGGGQNTFGQPYSVGSGIGENPSFTTEVGQGAAVLVASGSFVASAIEGAYTVRLENRAANVIESIQTNGAAFVHPAIVDGNDTITFVVGSACPQDLDGNGTIDLSDLAMVLSDFGKTGSDLAGDVDQSGNVDLTDLAEVLGAFGQTCN